MILCVWQESLERRKVSAIVRKAGIGKKGATMSVEKVKEVFEIYEMQDENEEKILNDEICAEADCCDCLCMCAG